ncbi:hypothetical protein ACH5RR_021676 [Cinchona calisaya]|uniref:Pol protein n=1 Tax=Cinchona calisaya TaxID=153742 RepID=A0ABD2ZI07_9GENT
MQNLRERRWMELLEYYDCSINYHPNKENAVVDTLSPTAQIAQLELNKKVQTKLILSNIGVFPELSAQIKYRQNLDLEIQEITRKIREGKLPNFIIGDDQIFIF